ncbi:hypothetical protein SAMN05216359_108100 [Roseateles sp. YR242]|uniref:hypothetical protein n=1 Tax=Roseateles sp. YR242 TaxID=1855305 RepID=UPI0008B864C3|nr:hypothetical protein [Roseateles sp. YR242]SEL37910.1 hypothetical protein SAMN05216359_108100 [Roseateles sp. YR242]
MSAGTAQHERFPPALEEGYVAVDPLRFEDRVAMVELLARQLRYVDPDNHDTGHWYELLENDTTLVLARIAAFDLAQRERHLAQHLDSAPLEALAQGVGAMAEMLDSWYMALQQEEADFTAQAMQERLRQLIRQQLAADLHWVRERHGQRRWQNKAIVPPLSTLWDPSAEALALLSDQRGNASARYAARHERDQLRRRHVAFHGAIESLQAKAHELIPAAWGTGQHEPAVALLMAFMKVCEKVQAQVNRFPARHAEFYYRDVLGFLPRGPRDDTVLVACQRDPRAIGEVKVGSGTLFDAGKDAAGRPVRFRSESTLAVTDTRVASVCSLFLERDRLISPERDFGFVTRAKACELQLGRGTDWRLFGGDANVPDARIGLAIVSPILALAEGDRLLSIELRMRHDTAYARRSLQELVAGVLTAGAMKDTDKAEHTLKVTALRRAMGVLLVRWLLAGADASPHATLKIADWQKIWEVAARVLQKDLPAPAVAGDPLSVFHLETDPDNLEPNRDLMFNQLFQGALNISLSAATGWFVATDVHISAAPAGGLALQVRLPHDAPAIIGCDPQLHGPEWETRLPMMRLEICHEGRIYAYSLLADIPFKEAFVKASVQGVRQLLLSNSLGRLDGTKPFMPFGPLPAVSSSFVVGSQEAARKNLTLLKLHLQWAGLPQEPGGFSAYYASYGLEQHNESFTAALSLMRDGRWFPCGGDSARQRLFAWHPGDGRLMEHQHFEVDAPTVGKQMRASEQDWGTEALPRNGLCRLQLSGPPGAFGHAAYPAVLSEVVNANARTRRHPRPVPNPPYTPVLEAVTLDYDADTVIALDRDDGPGDGVDGERLLHLRPFGAISLHLADAGTEHTLLPHFDRDGQLLIGLRSSDPGGTLTLLFEMKESPVRPGQQLALTRPQWATLVGQSWVPLPSHCVLADETDGFLTSGIVTLDLPRDMRSDHTLMPSGLYWLRISAHDGFDTFARLRDVRCQALRAVRAPAPPPANAGTQPPAPPTLLEAGRINRAIHTLSGVATVAQVGSSVGLRAAEDARALYTRAGERLQHKNRASTTWDMERLLLDRFPDVFKARCLTADEVVDDDGLGGEHLPPGTVVVVAVPMLPRNQPALACEQPRFSAMQLRRMALALKALASPFANIEVRNPMYEQLQVRGVVGLQRGAHAGATLQRMNQALVEMLSPWMDQGYGPRFDWTVRAEDIEARLRNMPGVAFITQLSILRLSQDDNGSYRLADTARASEEERRHVTHSRPWSLALPMPQHLLSDTEGFTYSAPVATGISKLAIGSTFVISGATA